MSTTAATCSRRWPASTRRWCSTENGGDRELRELAADLYVKGGDYTLDKLDPAERAALEAAGTKICFKPFIPGFSTTRIVEKIRRSL